MSAPLALGRSMVSPKLIPRGEDMPYPPPPAARFDENEDLPEGDDVNEMNSSEDEEEYQDPRPFQQVTQGSREEFEVAGFFAFFTYTDEGLFYVRLVKG